MTGSLSLFLLFSAIATALAGCSDSDTPTSPTPGGLVVTSTRAVLRAGEVLPLTVTGSGAPVTTVTWSTTGRGVGELWEAVRRFRTHSAGVRARRLTARNEFRLRELLTQRLLEHIEQRVLGPGEFERLVQRIAARELDPYTAASEILRRTLEQRADQ